jgi:hypothetical protein
VPLLLDIGKRWRIWDFRAAPLAPAMCKINGPEPSFAFLTLALDSTIFFVHLLFRVLRNIILTLQKCLAFEIPMCLKMKMYCICIPLSHYAKVKSGLITI